MYLDQWESQEAPISVEEFKRALSLHERTEVYGES